MQRHQLCLGGVVVTSNVGGQQQRWWGAVKQHFVAQLYADCQQRWRILSVDPLRARLGDLPADRALRSPPSMNALGQRSV